MARNTAHKTRSGAPSRPTSAGTSARPEPRTHRGGLEAYGLVIAAFGVLLLLALVSSNPTDVGLLPKLRSGATKNLVGPVGAHIADLLYRLLGITAYVIASTFLYFAGMLLAGQRRSIRGGGVLAFVLTLLFTCIGAHLLLNAYRPFGHLSGGAVGAWAGEILRALFATTGAGILTAAGLIASLVRLFGTTVSAVVLAPARAVRWAAGRIEAWQVARAEALEADDDREPDEADPGEPVSAIVLPEPESGDRVVMPTRLEPVPTAPAVTTERPLAPVVPIGRATVRPPAGLPTGPPPLPTSGPTSGPTSVPTSLPRTLPPSLPGADDEDGDEDELPAASPSRPRAPNGANGVEIADPLPVRAPVISDPVPARDLPDFAKQTKLPLETDVPEGPRLPYEFPSLTILDYEPPARGAVDRDALERAARTLEAKLVDFGVKGEVVRIQPGPVVTMFEYRPAPGIKISKIEGLVNDLTMALHALRIRIVAPIPGKDVVGVEVPSAVRETVYLKEILASPEFQQTRARLPIALGKDIVGNAIVADLAKMPHLLVAGATGSGKSVAINAFILSLIYRMKPRDLRMILVDPKMLELSVYDDIPHLLLPVVTEAKKASLALKWAVAEMERRYRLLTAAGVRNIIGFNQRVEQIQSGQVAAPDDVTPDELEHLPYLVIILDELADLMMTSGKEVEQSIARLAQMARAAGIHIVIATQRPSVDVITGLIKANFPTRLSFQVAQKVDSRTILDRMGAENLLGQGDMLFLPPGTSRLQRIQGCFVSDEEVQRVVSAVLPYGPPDYDMNILLDDDEEKKDLSEEEYDPMYDQALAVVVESKNASISYLQRRLKIGYNRSARIIERMQFDGVVSPPDHRGNRKVLQSPMPDLD